MQWAHGFGAECGDLGTSSERTRQARDRLTYKWAEVIFMQVATSSTVGEVSAG